MKQHKDYSNNSNTIYNTRSSSKLENNKIDDIEKITS